MSDPTPLQNFQCPQCSADVQADWACCPKCGRWLKAEGPLAWRLVAWAVVLTAFVLAVTLIARDNRDAGLAFGVLFGLPLAYVLGKAILYRMQGRPLTYGQLAMTSLRAFGAAIVLPWIVGVALVVLLCVLCFGVMGIAMMQGGM
ncbi:MAG: hypothetical protein SH850_27120 [Planctomycetaceae bacterium]|nr:hypothetical protein [Planctomycetaceae bacterium]